MPTLDSPSVLQFGYANQAGFLSNLVDRDNATFWQPYADTFDSYLTPVLNDNGTLIVGAAHPAIQFDFGSPVRIPFFSVKVETSKSLPPCWLLCSDIPATSVNDTVQAADKYAGYFTLEQMNAGAPLRTLAYNNEIRGRYWRFVSMATPPLE